MLIFLSVLLGVTQLSESGGIVNILILITFILWNTLLLNITLNQSINKKLHLQVNWISQYSTYSYKYQSSILSSFNCNFFGLGVEITVTATLSPSLRFALPKLLVCMRPLSPTPQSTKQPNGTTFLTTPGNMRIFLTTNKPSNTNQLTWQLIGIIL